MDTKEIFVKILSLLEENNKMLKELTDVGLTHQKAEGSQQKKVEVQEAVISKSVDNAIGLDDGVTAWFDEATKLMWEVKQRHNLYYTYTHSEADDYVVEMNSNNYSGYNDWRMPTKDELRTLLSKDKHNGAYAKKPVSLNGNYNYWSSTKYDENFKWCMNFKTGKEMKSERNNFDYVRLVRRVE